LLSNALFAKRKEQIDLRHSFCKKQKIKFLLFTLFIKVQITLGYSFLEKKRAKSK